MKRSNVLTAEHPERGTLWVAFDSSVHHVVGKVAESRFAARLAPFPDEASARWALKSACAQSAGAES